MIGPDDIGQRVVVRRTAGVVAGRRRFTDVTGRLEFADSERVDVRRDHGDLATVTRDTITAAKVIPPKPTSYRAIARWETACARTWPATETQWLGGWCLRASGGWSRRANSVLALGEPGLDFDAALAHVTGWYAARELPVIFGVPLPLSKRLETSLRERGWRTVSRVEVLTAEVAALAVADAGVGISREPDAAWLELAVGAEAERARDVLRGGDSAFATIAQRGRAIACGRVAVSDGLAVATNVMVSPALRGQGLAKRVIGALAEWARTRRAARLCVQVVEDNAAALGLYERLGFTRHHRYVYLRPD